jgi:hypothetical protein
MADVRDLAKMAPFFPYSSDNSNIERLCASLLFLSQVLISVLAVICILFQHSSLFSFPNDCVCFNPLKLFEEFTQSAILTAVKRRRIKIKIFRSPDNGCSTGNLHQK